MNINAPNVSTNLKLFSDISDIPIEVCPECSQTSVNKLVSAPSFRLKGGGWYETDFKTGSKKNIVDAKNEKPNKPKEQTKTTDQSTSKNLDKKT